MNIFAILLLNVLQEDLTEETTKRILDTFAKGEKPKPGPQSGRHTSENSAGLTALASKVRTLRPSVRASARLTARPAIRPWGVLHTRVQLDRQRQRQTDVLH